jgi:hypothetical protein
MYNDSWIRNKLNYCRDCLQHERENVVTLANNFKLQWCPVFSFIIYSTVCTPTLFNVPIFVFIKATKDFLKCLCSTFSFFYLYICFINRMLVICFVSSYLKLFRISFTHISIIICCNQAHENSLLHSYILYRKDSSWQSPICLV